MQYMLGMTIGSYNENLFMKARVGNLTFDGVDSPLLHMSDGTDDDSLGNMLDEMLPFDRFGWFYEVRMLSSA